MVTSRTFTADKTEPVAVANIQATRLEVSRRGITTSLMYLRLKLRVAVLVTLQLFPINGNLEVEEEVDTQAGEKTVQAWTTPNQDKSVKQSPCGE
jgi:hypothetical protein